MSMSKQERGQMRATWAGRYAALQQVCHEVTDGCAGSPPRLNRPTGINARQAHLDAADHGRPFAGQPA